MSRMNRMVKTTIEVNTLIKPLMRMITLMVRMTTLTKVEKLAPLTKCTKISTLYMAHNSVK